MKISRKEAIEEALEGLKDFQKSTVNYVFEQLFEQGRRRMLVADEVGLGKTIVARGVIAKAYEEHLKKNPNEEFHVVYICSNQALAQQNLKKLNLFHKHKIPMHSIGRLVFLAQQPEKSALKFRISTLTPGTSFYITRSEGIMEERILIYRLFTHPEILESGLDREGIKWILKASVEHLNWTIEIRKIEEGSKKKIRDELFSVFKQRLSEIYTTHHEMPKICSVLQREEQSLWEAIEDLSQLVNEDNYSTYRFQNELIRKLRKVLTEVCLEYLDANLFILDEFQRFKPLIDGQSETPESKLARRVFQIPGSKVLMLSATPYKPYTTRFDQQQGEDHFAEFKTVLRFLLEEESEPFWQQYEQDRQKFFELIRHPDRLLPEIEAAKESKVALESVYRKAMARTERLLVSKDHNAMIKTGGQHAFELLLEDIQDFIRLDRIISQLHRELPHGVANSLEFAKSAPFALSFLDHYKLKEELKKYKDHSAVRAILKKHPKAWLDLEAINQYQPILEGSYPNGKLRRLIEETIHPNAHLLLWTPPSLRYYSTEGVYKDSRGFSKTLIFSSWVMVPRMISTLLSYEVERRTIPDSVTEQEKADSRTYFPPPDADSKKYRRHPRPLLLFKLKEGSAQNMTNFSLLYPSPTLASWCHPRQNLRKGASLDEIRARISNKVGEIIEQEKLKERFSVTNGTSEKWYWALPLILDRRDPKIREQVQNWFEKGAAFSQQNTDPEAGQEEEKTDSKGKTMHLEELRMAFDSPREIGLGPIPDDIGEVMADMILGSPAIVAFRSLQDFFSDPLEIMSGAAVLANGFIALFNKPESIAAIRLSITSDSDKQPYWQTALGYAVEGNIQAVLDEYIFLLYECENERESAGQLGGRVADVMNIRTSTNQVDSLSTFMDGQSKKMRCHFALDYGNQRVETASGEKRMVNLRETFNSPFRPFVLASTSIGQEGLDFHYYCRKIMHWNLPSNAIDIEQREGRINRFMGLMIRQNLARKYGHNLENVKTNPWQEIFRLAEREEKEDDQCDLIPFWHVEGEEDLKIERLVPLHPFSNDIQKYKNILNVLTLYRLTFGQPRQEELIETFRDAGLSPVQLQQIRDELMIDLSPISFNNHK